MATEARIRRFQRPLRVAFHLPGLDDMMDGATPRWADVLALPRRAEAVGFDAVTIGEHLFFRDPDTTGGG